MKRFKLNFAVAAFLLGSVIAFTQSSFTPAKKSLSALSPTIYDFTGSMVSQAQTASFYLTEGSTPPSCDENEVIPCRISVPAGESLSTWLSNEHTPEQVLADAIDTKD